MKSLWPVIVVLVVIAVLVVLVNKTPDRRISGHGSDTVYVATHDTLHVSDTLRIAPKVITKTITMHDTVMVQKLQEYVVENRFEDSAWVRHTWTTDAALFVIGNRWDYLPAPRMEILSIDTVEIREPWTRRIAFTIGVFGIGAIAGMLTK